MMAKNACHLEMSLVVVLVEVVAVVLQQFKQGHHRPSCKRTADPQAKVEHKLCMDHGLGLCVLF